MNFSARINFQLLWFWPQVAVCCRRLPNCLACPGVLGCGAGQLSPNTCSTAAAESEQSRESGTVQVEGLLQRVRGITGEEGGLL